MQSLVQGSLPVDKSWWAWVVQWHSSCSWTLCVRLWTDSGHCRSTLGPALRPWEEEARTQPGEKPPPHHYHPHHPPLSLSLKKCFVQVFVIQIKAITVISEILSYVFRGGYSVYFNIHFIDSFLSYINNNRVTITWTTLTPTHWVILTVEIKFQCSLASIVVL